MVIDVDDLLRALQPSNFRRTSTWAVNVRVSLLLSELTAACCCSRVQTSPSLAAVAKAALWTATI